MEPATADNPGHGYTLLIVSIALANFMAAFDSTIVTIALPVIAKIFSLPVTMASWVITVYVLVMAACVLVFGKLSDVIGYKKVFLYGFALFTVASFACGFLPEFVRLLSRLHRLACRPGHRCRHVRVGRAGHDLRLCSPWS